MVTADVGVDLVTKLKDKGFRDLEKSSKKQDKILKALGKRLLAAFSVVAVVNFGKQSVKAFQDSQKEANRLTTQLQSLNLGFAQPFLTDFIQKTQLATGISGGVLTDSFNTLSQATNDVSTAQRLLAVSLDISAATGRDLSTVTTALQRGYAGQVTALTRLKIGFTTANLKGRDFDDVLSDLENKFKGSSARAADTLAGKMARLTEAVDEAKEAFGEGLVKGLEDSGQSIEDLQQDIIELGETLGRLAASTNNLATDTISAFTRIRESAAVQGVLTLFDKLVRGIGFVVTGELLPSMDAVSARLAGEERRKAEEANRAALRTRRQILRVEGQVTKEITKQTAAEKKSALEKKRAAELERLRNSIAYKFDIDAINLQAALRRNISAADKARVIELAALKKADYETDEEALKTLQTAIKDTAAISPEIKFTDNLDDLQERLKALIENKYNINVNIGMTQMPNLVPNLASQNAAVLAAKTDKAAAFKEAASASAAFAGISSADAAASLTQAREAVATATTPEEKAAADAAVSAASAYVAATAELTESVAAADYAAALAALGEANEFLNQSIEASLGQGLIPDLAGVGDTGVTVNVNVQGSVVAQNDLVAAVTDAVYSTQRRGNLLLIAE